MRIGQGIDAHRFSDDPARTLWLGLVAVPNAPGLDGHSDADCATHALCDAILGAASLGDLGRHFSDTDERWRGISSGDLLSRVVGLARDAHWRVTSGDVTIVAETPRLADYLTLMSQRLSEVTGAAINVKATTTEKMCAIGRGEGIAASAVVLVEENI